MTKAIMKGQPSGQPQLNEIFWDVFRRRLSQRRILNGARGGASLLVLATSTVLDGLQVAAEEEPALTFQQISPSDEDRIIVAPGYDTKVLMRWGDPLHLEAPTLDFQRQTAAAQAQQCGYNGGFVTYFPLPHHLSRDATHGILVMNHEDTDPEMMFPGYQPGSPTPEQVDSEMAAHGVTIVELVRLPLGGWRYRIASDLNRRITGETPIEITGPAAGHDWRKVSYDPQGRRVRGTLNNCGGRMTPWGTYLTCEANFHQYFANRAALPHDDSRKAVHGRYGLPTGQSPRRWERYHARFDLNQEPNEPFRFGWVMEIDPYDPHYPPRKHTSLGRFKHEGATCVLAPDGRVAVYTGDAERYEYLYKFVTTGHFNPRRRELNFGLLDSGTLYVARFNDDGTGEWLPLAYGHGPLTEANGFASQSDILINTRWAADLLGATRMDRLDGIATNPSNGKVYCVMTHTSRRTHEQVAPVNRRGVNRYGHLIECTEDRSDCTAETFTWALLLFWGESSNPADGAYFTGVNPRLGRPVSSPRQISFDLCGNLWVATASQAAAFRKNDGVYAIPVAGLERGSLHQFLSSVPGGTITGLTFTPNNHTLFCSVQHPGKGSSLDDPSSTWPDRTIPPRPSVIAVEKSESSRVIGS
jgi:uncharacterized protein